MSELGISTWDKIRLLSWKNWNCLWSNRTQTLLSLITPSLALFILILLRFSVRTHQVGVVKYEAIDLEKQWTKTINNLNLKRKMLPEEDQSIISGSFPKIVLAFSPNGTQFTDLIQKASSDYLANIEVEGYGSNKKMREAMFKEHHLAGVHFYTDVDAVDVEYGVVFPSELRFYKDPFLSDNWQTHLLFNIRKKKTLPNFDRDGGHLGYIREGFASLQNAIGMSVIKMAWNKKGLEQAVPTVKIRRFPEAEHTFDELLTSTDFSLPFTLLVGYLFPCLIFTKSVVIEKEMGIVVYLQLLGISHSNIFFSWLIKGFMKIFLVTIPISIILKVHWSDGYGICTKSSWMALLFVLLSYGMASVSFCFLISSLTTRPTSAVIMVGVLWVFTFIPFMLSTLPSSYNPIWSLICSNSTMGFLFENIVLLEQLKDGLQWNNIWDKVRPADVLSVGGASIILICLCVIYTLIGLYLEKSIHTIAYILKKWYMAILKIQILSEKENSLKKKFSRKTKIIEVDHEYRKIAIEVTGINKIIHGTHILKNITFNVNEGDITVIMGHNGSGKTILLSIIAGILAPTSGHVHITGTGPIQAEYGGMDMGVSLQQYMLFPDLTVMDQIIFFSRLKGLSGDLLKAEVKKYLSAMSLEDVADVLTRDLTTGLQCHLSVCCALCGNSKYVFLDEPSTDIDLYAQKKFWDLLISEKANRTIIITTHSFNEAELLGDRIAILSKGELMCYGSSYFLNTIYEKGYRLECVKNENCESDQITQIINKYIPNTTPESDIGSEISYIINEEYIDIVPKLLYDLEASLSELKISSCCIRETGIEEIFVHVSSGDSSEEDYIRHSDIMNGYSIYLEEYNNLSFLKKYDTPKGFQLIIKQFWAILYKRLYISRTYTKMTVMQLCLPGLITYLTIVLANPSYERKLLPEISFRLEHYPRSLTILDIHRKQSPVTSSFNATHFKATYSDFCNSAGFTHKLKTTSIHTLTEYVLMNEGLEDFDTKVLIGATFESSDIIAWFNNYPLHTVPLSLNMVHNGIIRMITNKGSIMAYHEPLPYSTNFNSNYLIDQQNLGKYLAVNLSYMIAFGYGSCLIYFIHENQTHFKLLQYVSGARPITLLCANMVYDIFLAAIESLFVFCVILSFADNTIYRVQSAVSFPYMMIVFAICITPFYYAASKLFKNFRTGYIVLCIFNANSATTFILFFILLFALLMVFSLVTLVAIYGAVTSACNKSKYQHFIDYYRWLFRILPHFSLCECLSYIFRAEGYSKMGPQKDFLVFLSVNLDKCIAYPNCCRDTSSYFCCVHIQMFPALMYLLAIGVLSMLLLLGLEYRKDVKEFLGCRIPRDNIWLLKKSFERKFERHDSVIKEELRVNSLRESQYRTKPLVLANVSKVYGKRVVVNRVSLVMERCECVGLLGPNASGKSTILKMIIGEEDMSSGRAYVEGISLTKPMYGCIGYCPQGDVLPMLLTCRQSMELICHLRGIPRKHIPDVCICLAKVMGFINDFDKPIELISPGNRRRLNAALSFIGNPSLICMDVYGSGIDAIGRRQLLNITCRMLKQGTSIIVSMVSLRECERFCTRIGQLGYGSLLCLDTVDNFADMYTNSYILRVKVRFSMTLVHDGNETMPLMVQNPYLKVLAFVEEHFPNTVLKNQRGCMLEFLIPVENVTLSLIFKKITRNAFNLNVDTFSIKRNALSIPFLEMVERSNSLFGPLFTKTSE